MSSIARWRLKHCIFSELFFFEVYFKQKKSRHKKYLLPMNQRGSSEPMPHMPMPKTDLVARKSSLLRNVTLPRC